MNVWMKLLPLTYWTYSLLTSQIAHSAPAQKQEFSLNIKPDTLHPLRVFMQQHQKPLEHSFLSNTPYLISFRLQNITQNTSFFHATQGYIFKNVLTFLWVQGGLGLRLRVTSLPTQMFDHKIWELIFSLFRTLYECCIQLQCCTGITLKYICIFCGNHSGVLSID